MNVMVSARVPVELRDQVARRLETSGHTTTELINAAYEDFARTGKMPGDSHFAIAQKTSGKRRLSERQRKALAQSIQNSTLAESVLTELASDSSGLIQEEEVLLNGNSRFSIKADNDYKKILTEGKAADYEALTRH